jgi:Gar1/Naf1 RNA binding region
MGEGSIFCSESRECIGRVEDVFGQVTNPLYAVQRCGAAVALTLADGDRVFTVPSLSERVDCAAASAAPARDRDEAEEGDGEGEDTDIEMNHLGDAEAMLAAHAVRRGSMPSSSSARRFAQDPLVRPGAVRGSGRASRARGQGRCALPVHCTA